MPILDQKTLKNDFEIAHDFWISDFGLGSWHKLICGWIGVSQTDEEDDDMDWNGRLFLVGKDKDRGKIVWKKEVKVVKETKERSAGMKKGVWV